MKISDFTMSRDIAESIYIAHCNDWEKTWKLNPIEPWVFHIEPCDGVNNGYLALGDLRFDFHNIVKIEVSKRDSNHGTLTIKCQGSAPVYIPVEWCEYEDTDLHPHESHWHGVYKDEWGYLFECHEWFDWFDDDCEDDVPMPDGAVYFEMYAPDTDINAILDGVADALDGGVMGYIIGQTLEYALSDWIGDNGITRVA